MLSYFELRKGTTLAEATLQAELLGLFDGNKSTCAFDSNLSSASMICFYKPNIRMNQYKQTA